MEARSAASAFGEGLMRANAMNQQNQQQYNNSVQQQNQQQVCDSKPQYDIYGKFLGYRTTCR